MVKIIFFAAALTANSYVAAHGFFGDQWKEDVVTYDGKHIIVDREQSYGGPHDIGQQKPVHYQKINFRLPNSEQLITWENSASELGYVLYEPLLLDVVDGAAYLVVAPKMCAAWSLMGRPNPPYTIFKYKENKWETIYIKNLPAQISKSNLLVAAVPPDNLLQNNTISANDINIMNGYMRDDYLKVIFRKKIKYVCEGI